MNEVEDLKNMSSYEVKNFIRQRLMYSGDEIKFIFNEVCDPVCHELLSNIRPNLTLHKRFDMSEDKECNNRILSKFDDLKLMQSFHDAKLTFYKGCADFNWCTNSFSSVQSENLCGFGTVDIIHFIMGEAWGLKQD